MAHRPEPKWNNTGPTCDGYWWSIIRDDVGAWEPSIIEFRNGRILNVSGALVEDYSEWYGPIPPPDIFDQHPDEAHDGE